MLLIQSITSDSYQKQSVSLDDGTFITFTLRFVPLQQSWFFDEITWQDWTVQGLRCSNQPNMLYQWKNLIPFGLGCFSTNNRDPQLQEDFQTGASKLYILTEAEVQEYEEFLRDG